MPDTYVRVALDVPLAKPFDYLANSANTGDIGRRVRVPFGKKEKVGILLELVSASDQPSKKIRAVIDIDRSLPALPEDILELFRFCASYYHFPIGQIALAALPTALRRWQFRLAENDLRYTLTPAGHAAFLENPIPAKATAQRRLFSRLMEGETSLVELGKLNSQARTVLNSWRENGWVTESQTRISGREVKDAPFLQPGQQSALHQITKALGSFKPFLLHGVTGSGKTEVYLRLTEQVLERGQSVLILVPEIGLTPQFTNRVQERFPLVPISVLHSGLAEGERLSRWRLALENKARIVLGTRLSIFTPMPDLGLIVVDEEHDASFSQQEGLRYSARDLAVFRARQRNIPVVLGSATPSLESWHNAAANRYTLLSLPERATGASLPEIALIDTRLQAAEGGLRQPALQAISETIQRGEQALVFLNRRGYSPVIYCPSCAWVAPCHRCSTRLTVHLRNRKLRCHHCGHEETIPNACPSCGNPDLLTLGQGTQRIEETLAQHFPAARLARADRDAIRRKGSWEAMQSDMHEGRIDLIIGTQLIAKGHDFPNLTLVIVLDADGALFSQDYRAEERLFAMLMQVSGRAGRAGKPGRVLIQTGFPQHPLFAHLLMHDFPGFASEQLSQRKTNAFPPFSYQAVLRAESVQLADAMKWLHQARLLAPAPDGVDVFTPMPAVMLKKAGYERAQLWLQSASRSSLQEHLSNWTPRLRELPAGNVRWHLDVDPAEA